MYVPEKLPIMIPAAPWSSGITRTIESTTVIATLMSEYTTNAAGRCSIR